MAQQIINIGSAYNDPSADKQREAWDKANDNFTELYTKKYAYFSIGTWNMDTTASVPVTWTGYAAGMKVININAVIFSDSGEPFGCSIFHLGGGGVLIQDDGYGVKIFTLTRAESGFFDSAGYDGSANRGYVFVEYIEAT